VAVIAAENYRSTVGFVTDVSPEVFVSASGWTGASGNVDASAGLDRRLAGVVYKANDGSQATRVITLPAAGTYLVKVAVGYTDPQVPQYLQIRDNTTPVLTISKPAGSGDHRWFNASGVELDEAAWVAGYATAGVSLTFATTTLRLAIGNPTASGAASSTIAHFSVETVGGAAAVLTGSATLALDAAAVTLVPVLAGAAILMLTATANLTGGVTAITGAADLILDVFGALFDPPPVFVPATVSGLRGLPTLGRRFGS
jgi:hypothetical protein